MKSHPYRAILFVISTTVSLSTQTAAGETARFGAVQIDLIPRKVHEACESLRPGDVVAYAFEASGPIDFNVHYHAEGKVDYPIKVEDVLVMKGEFRSMRKEEYCFMWSNNGMRPVSIEGRIGAAP